MMEGRQNENSNQTAPAPGPRAAPQAPSGRASRRLVNRTASWGEAPVNGICRWCYELTASPKTRWHLYCLNAYRVASGQHPDEIQRTLCEICGDPPDEIDHRLSIRGGPGARPSGDAAGVHA